MMIPADDTLGPGQGHWTYETYAALPHDDHRYEIVDGVLYMTPAPSRGHQIATGRLYRYLSMHIEDTRLGEVYIAPFDVELGSRTVVQPDVIVVLNAHLNRVTESRIIGSPDLVVEVSSPGTAGHDRDEKKHAYARAGVPEYWIVDPWSRTIEVLTLDADSYSSQGVFEGKAVLPSSIIPHFPVHVEQFFA